MNIIVCIKQVPEVTDADLEITSDGTDIDKEDLEMVINEWDNYAVEEAVRIKEAQGGKVTVVTLGDEDSEDVLRRALAMGADAAVLIDEEGFEGSDAAGIARGLLRVVEEMEFDLVLTGAQSSDDNWAQVGLLMAEWLGLPFASLAVKVEPKGETVVVHRELEANTLEEVELPLPAAVTIQTGINEPRYVSIMGIRKVRNIQIEEVSAGDLGLEASQIGKQGSSIEKIRLSLPEEGEGAEILTGTMEEICEKAAQVIKERGGVA
ncbi:MAG: electron transfer flavoprotein subunit beta [Deltaproteobacteria bacterium]|nr:MAG: electron transfer flavoprotein subunit beta [Deltaproteobacteria bacterium]